MPEAVPSFSPTIFDAHAPGHEQVDDALPGRAARQHVHRIAVLRRAHDGAVAEQGAGLGRAARRRRISPSAWRRRNRGTCAGRSSTGANAVRAFERGGARRDAEDQLRRVRQFLIRLTSVTPAALARLWIRSA